MLFPARRSCPLIHRRLFDITRSAPSETSAGTAVMKPPPRGSTTRSPGWLKSLTNLSTSSSGSCQGLQNFSLALTIDTSNHPPSFVHFSWNRSGLASTWKQPAHSVASTLRSHPIPGTLPDTCVTPTIVEMRLEGCDYFGQPELPCVCDEQPTLYQNPGGERRKLALGARILIRRECGSPQG